MPHSGYPWAFLFSLSMKTQSTIASFLGGVLSTIVGILSVGVFIGGAVWVARKVAGPAKYVVVDQSAK